MNEGLTRLKGPGHPVVWLRVNCPLLGLPGQQSSSRGFTASAVQCVCSCTYTAEHFFCCSDADLVSASSYVANVMYFKSQVKRLTSDGTRKTEYRQISALY